ncbi:hypothetical protein NM208_g13324 [Fusarium decemcellulare]|uniref:Uncharacterized protein n=1 Tax=Fusarium decemcellulare TaxID=57161 RepID=A0ACC1RNS4_9HYPO|nr:hypothetical protein NM208_g13324 [Fusarium decemcellulare]
MQGPASRLVLALGNGAWALCFNRLDFGTLGQWAAGVQKWRIKTSIFEQRGASLIGATGAVLMESRAFYRVCCSCKSSMMSIRPSSLLGLQSFRMPALPTGATHVGTRSRDGDSLRNLNVNGRLPVGALGTTRHDTCPARTEFAVIFRSDCRIIFPPTIPPGLTCATNSCRNPCKLDLAIMAPLSSPAIPCPGGLDSELRAAVVVSKLAGGGAAAMGGKAPSTWSGLMRELTKSDYLIAFHFSGSIGHHGHAGLEPREHELNVRRGVVEID